MNIIFKPFICCFGACIPPHEKNANFIDDKEIEKNFQKWQISQENDVSKYIKEEINNK